MTKTYHISMVHVSIKYHSIVFMYKDCFVHCIKNKFKCSLIVKHVTPQKVVNIKKGEYEYTHGVCKLSYLNPASELVMD
ncbi:hypothetical protein Hanom_Chr05g00433431 [Helianthus anomalus]